MKIYRRLPPAAERAPSALTIGNFDGVHRGHQALLARVVQAARARQLAPTVLTFEPHPREFFAPEQAPVRIANIRDKLQAIEACGIERVFIQHFNRRFATQTAAQFIDDVLVAGLNVRWLMVGDDFRFGTKRSGDFALLQDAGRRLGFEVACLPPVLEGGVRISSSEIRGALAAGALDRARRLLGHAYSVSGRVLHGRKLGHTIGFPTLNLRIAHRTRMRQPAVQGVFAVKVHGLTPQPLAGVASVGTRPTVDDSGRWLLEVHLFDFDRQIYGRLVRVEFVQKLRQEAKYATLEQLIAAMRNDAAQARAVLGASA